MNAATLLQMIAIDGTCRECHQPVKMVREPQCPPGYVLYRHFDILNGNVLVHPCCSSRARAKLKAKAVGK